MKVATIERADAFGDAIAMRSALVTLTSVQLEAIARAYAIVHGQDAAEMRTLEAAFNHGHAVATAECER